DDWWGLDADGSSVREWDHSSENYRLLEQVNYFFTPSGMGDVLNYVASNGPGGPMYWYPKPSSLVPNDAVINGASLFIQTKGVDQDTPGWDRPDATKQPDLSTITIIPHHLSRTDTAMGHPPDYYLTPGLEPITLSQVRPGSKLTVP